MKAENLKLGDPVYRVDSDRIFQFEVTGIEQVQTDNLSIKFKSESLYTYKVIAKTGALEGQSELNVTYYFDLECARLAQVIARQNLISAAFKRMEDAQKAYNELVRKYALTEPSKPQKA